mmetsp:Transcript_139409/g.445887  ORF Transcript_139409/g.445887 Transcript_139409/m.445887 type:complete len:312 (-) Transcript_139409:416-1351(-)
MCLLHGVDVADEEALGDHALDQRPLREQVHVAVHDARRHRALDCLCGLPNSLVDNPLRCGKASRDGEGASDICCVAVVLSTHVMELHLPREHLLSVWEGSVAVMKDGTSGAAGADAMVANASATTQKGEVSEVRLGVVLRGARPDAAHDRDVGIGGDVVDELEEPNLLLIFEDAALCQCVPEPSILDHREALRAIEARCRQTATRVPTDAMVCQKAPRTECEAQHLRHVVHVMHAIDLEGLLEPLQRSPGAHPRLVFLRKPRHEKQRTACGDVDSRVAVGLSDAKEPLEVALLPEVPHCVGVINRKLLPSL